MTDLNDVVAAIDKVQKTVESRPKAAHTFAALTCGIFIYMIISSWATLVWDSRSVVALRYGVPTEKVTIQEMPHDCDFWRSPLGVKGCSYVRETSVVKTGVNASGQHVVTYDDGQTWTLIEDPSQVQTGVFVMWKKE
jgi:hypothetical protein